MKLYKPVGEKTLIPKGTIYLTVNNVNPSIYFGGTWEQIKDKFLLCAGDTYKAGNTGGEASHKITTEEMPSHTHGHENGQTSSVVWFPEATGFWVGNSGSGRYTTLNFSNISKTGGGQAHNNMPPYIVVYVWKRVK